MKLLQFVGLATVATAFTGCAALVDAPPRDTPMESEVKEYTFVKTLPNGEPLAFSHIGNSVVLNIQDAITIEKAAPESEYADISPYQGSDIWEPRENSPTSGAVQFGFMNGEIFNNTESVYSTDQWAVFSIELQEQGDKQIVKITTPGIIRTYPGGFASYHEPLLSDEEAKEEISRINDAINPVVRVAKFYEGEFTVGLSEREVKWNIRDGLQSYIGADVWAGEDQSEYSLIDDSTYDILSSRGGIVDLHKMKGNKMKPVVIELSPTASGTNVKYTFRMVATAYPDGTVDDQSAKADEYIAKIKRVARD